MNTLKGNFVFNLDNIFSILLSHQGDLKKLYVSLTILVLVDK